MTNAEWGYLSFGGDDAEAIFGDKMASSLTLVLISCSVGFRRRGDTSVAT